LSTKNGHNIYYKSGWELSFIKYLDSNLDVISYVYEPFAIEYKFQHKRNYIPDFLVEYADGHKELVEIKPSNKLKDPQIKAKFRAAKIYCKKNNLKFVVISRKELRRLKIA
jgi:hypothetical protein